MRICPNCGNNVDDGVAFCKNCGCNMANQQPFQYQQPVYDQKDHTAEFDAGEVSKNKLFASLPYFLGILGIVIALLINQKEESSYLLFHIKQGVKIAIVSSIAIIIPFVGWFVSVVLFVLALYSGFITLNGKSKEVPIISSIDLLK
ncbi:MAG: hypothetical protein J6L89_07140 [Clostridia bacterium]|nr:hypothetical protein [Clostridia bacterium]